MIPKGSYLIIQNVQPQIDGARYAVKREIGDHVKVSAEIFREGHGILRAELLWRKEGSKRWSRIPMKHVNPGLDLWEAVFEPVEIGMHEYRIEAYTDHFASWVHDTRRKYEAGEKLESEAIEGIHLVQDAAKRAPKKAAAMITGWVKEIEALTYPREQAAVMFSDSVVEAVCAYPLRKGVETGVSVSHPLYVDQLKARFASWYEVFPRSTGSSPDRSATWNDVENFLPYVADLGFDVLYFPPIHPIGKSFKKGRNNSLTATEDDPGCPYAIGNEYGGHFDVCEQLGTMEEFEQMVQRAAEMNIDIAIDFAINCSYDHPYLKEHPDWFYRRPDGTIKYAENPPKKYEDIYGFDFYSEAWPEIWQEMKRVFLFWIQHGVKIFRVDNPHTKPVIFWEWVIGEIQQKHPDVIFLAEAFTKPKMMRVLAKAGFTQSYTYFTWRNSKQEMTEYLTELTTSEMKEYFRPNFFPNTPDILPPILQEAGRPAFKFRFFLAATLSPTYGIYNSYELCENHAIPGTEEYQNSEKYEIRHWDWDRPGNIRDYITRINQIRRDNPALQFFANLKFYESNNEHILFYGKMTPDKRNILLFAVNMDPYHTQEARLIIPLEEFGIDETITYQLHELLQGFHHDVVGREYIIRLDPNHEPAAIFVIHS